MQYHKIVYEIKELLEKNDIQYKFFEHEPVRTSEEALKQYPQFTLSQGAKAIILRVKQKDGERSFIMAVFPGDKRLSDKKMKKILGAKGITFATKEESDKITEGIEFGGVPPFGNLFGLDVYVDKTLLDNDEIIFNCGDRRASIAMKAQDYINLVQPTLESFV